MFTVQKLEEAFPIRKVDGLPVKNPKPELKNPQSKAIRTTILAMKVGETVAIDMDFWKASLKTDPRSYVHLFSKYHDMKVKTRIHEGQFYVQRVA